MIYAYAFKGAFRIGGGIGFEGLVGWYIFKTTYLVFEFWIVDIKTTSLAIQFNLIFL